jgi:hypothetical protein
MGVEVLPNLTPSTRQRREFNNADIRTSHSDWVGRLRMHGRESRDAWLNGTP